MNDFELHYLNPDCIAEGWECEAQEFEEKLQECFETWLLYNEKKSFNTFESEFVGFLSLYSLVDCLEEHGNYGPFPDSEDERGAWFRRHALDGWYAIDGDGFHYIVGRRDGPVYDGLDNFEFSFPESE